MMKIKKIFAVSFIAMLAVSTANATVVTQSNIVGANGVTVSVPSEGDNAGKVEIKSAIAYGTSSSAESATTKTVSIPSITSLEPGQMIVVVPSVDSTAGASSLQLNSFAAKPMRYNGVALTTTTDGYAWKKNTPAVYVYDGNYWQFVGYDANSTYSAMTDAEVEAGTGTTGRTIKPVTLKSAIQTWAPAESIATDSATGVVKGGGNVAIANDGTMSVDLSGKQDKLASGHIVAGTNTGNVVTSISASNGQITVNKAKETIKNVDIATNAAIADSKIARTGTITSGDTNIPTGGTVYTAINDAKAATLSGTELTGTGTTGRLITGAQYGAKQDVQIGAAKVSGADSTDKGKAVVVDADGKISMSTNKLGSAAYTDSTAYDAAGAAAAVENKLDDGASGYDINAKSLKVQGTSVLTSLNGAVLTSGAQTVGGAKTFSDAATFSSSATFNGTTKVSGANTTAGKASDGTTVAAVSDGDVKKAVLALDSKKEEYANKVTSISSASTDVQYPSAKAVYTAVEAAKTAATGAVTATGSNGVNASASGGAVSVSGIAAGANQVGVVKLASGSTNTTAENVSNKVTVENYEDLTSTQKSSTTLYPSMKTAAEMVKEANDALTSQVTNLNTTKQDKSTAVTHTAGTAAGTTSMPVYVNDSGVATQISVFGTVANNDTAGQGGSLVKGKTVYTEVRPAQTSNGTGYLGAPASTSAATNLTNLDTALKTIHPNTGEVKIPSGSETSSTLASIWVE